jgi:hypothetical protein
MNFWIFIITWKCLEIESWLGTFTPSERVALGAAFLVLIGVVGEYVADANAIEKRKWLKKWVKRSSMAILVLGLAGDVLGIVMGQAEMALLTKQAGDAAVSAKKANDEADAVHKKADALDKRLDAAGKNADAVSKRAGELNEYIDRVRSAAEAAVTDRHIIFDDKPDRKAKCEALRKYRDTPVTIVFVPENEARTLALEIRAELWMCGWQRDSVMVESQLSTPIPPGEITEGVQIRTMLPRNPADIAIPPDGATQPPVVTALMELLILDLSTRIPGVLWAPDGYINGAHPEGLIMYGFKIPENGMVITVGRNPSELYLLAVPHTPNPMR